MLLGGDSAAAAILLMAYGSPNSLEEAGEYLSQVRGGRTPTQMEIEHLKERYRRVGGRTPLLQITASQAKALQEKLHAENIPVTVYFGMKHWHPFVEDVVQRIVSDNPPLIVGVALAPHYSQLSIGGYEECVKRGLARGKAHTRFVMVKSWHTQPSLVKALSDRVSKGLQRLDNPGEASVLFIAHSLPRRAVSEDDPYQSQLMETSRLVAEQADATNWDFAFQSASGPLDAWLGPSIKDKIADLSNKGFKEILACPVGFVSDHLEILYDLDVEAKEYAASHGVRLERTASLNDDPLLIDAVASIVRPFVSALAVEPS